MLAITLTASYGWRDVGCRRIWIFPVAGDWVVELVGLEPTQECYGMWGMSDHLTLSNTRYRQQYLTGRGRLP